MSVTPKKALFLSLAAFLAVLIAVAIIWAVAGSDTALILGLSVFVIFYAIIIWLYRKVRDGSA